MAKAVSFNQFTAWMEKNKQRTWFVDWNKLDHMYPSLEVKYLVPSIDTRNMTVTRITTHSFGQYVDVSEKDKFKGSILNLLDKRLNEGYKILRKRLEVKIKCK